jgi:5-methylcytosine-specific restriction endonuclease McrBC regulatory subunit McrC
MARLYERYVRRLFRRAFGPNAVPPKDQLTFPLGGTSHRIELDGLYRGETRRVIECKYRLVEDAQDLSFDEGEVLNSHLFQAVAYAAHQKVSANEALIIYPGVNLPQPMVEALRVTGFQSPGGVPLRVRVLLVSLAHPATATATALRDLLPP